MFGRGAWLGQVPLILGPSSWGAGELLVRASQYPLAGIPPYWGEWGVVDVGSGGYMKDTGRVGPFATIDEAFHAAAEAAVAHGATGLPTDGWAQVKDSRGHGVGPVT
jgi:hypothetical protein